MNLHPLLTSFILATCLTGCATFTHQEMTQIRQHGVSPAVVGKMERGHVLSPGDVIELTRRGVPDDFIIRQIHDARVDYILGPAEIRRLQAAHVSRPVIDALFVASQIFASHYSRPGRIQVYTKDPYYFSSYYYAPYAYYYPYSDALVALAGVHHRGDNHWH